jgi:general stress protein YciG
MSEKREEMTVREAGKLGGEKRAAELGHDGYAALGRKGGATTKARHGNDFYTRIGQKGGDTVRRTKGQKFFQEIGRKGGQKVRELIERGKIGVASDLIRDDPDHSTR